MSWSGPFTSMAGRGAGANVWSMEDVRRLRELASLQLPIEEIAARLRRSPSAVKNKAGMHGISLQRRLRASAVTPVARTGT